MRQDPGFDVNMDQDGQGQTLLHIACSEDSSRVIPLLLAHPDIDPNLKDDDGYTAFYSACLHGSASCVRLLLRDFRVKVNEPANGCTPLYLAARWGHLDIIKWWVASGREMDLGKPGDIGKTDAIRLCGSGDPAGEIQGESTGNQARNESGAWSAR